MQFSPETNHGLDTLRKIIERTEVLSLAEPIRINGGNAFILVISANGKEIDFCLSREQLDDTPATPGYREAAEAFARSLDARFQNVDPNYFVSSSVRLLSISPEWPALPLIAHGGGLRAAMGVRVPLKDVLTEEIAICHVVITHSQTFPSAETMPYHRLTAIINSIRAEVDNGNILFYPTSSNIQRSCRTLVIVHSSVYRCGGPSLNGIRSRTHGCRIGFRTPFGYSLVF